MSGEDLPDRLLLTKSETVNWIAFNRASDGDMTGVNYVREHWQLDSSPEPIESCGMLLALRAIAEGRPFWVAKPPPPGTPDFIAAGMAQVPPSYAELDARARRMVEKSGRTARELADDLEADLIELAERIARHRAARMKLGDAQHLGQIKPVGRPAYPPYDEAPGATIWYGKADVLGIWPRSGGQMLLGRCDEAICDDLHEVGAGGPAGRRAPEGKRPGPKPVKRASVKGTMLAEIASGSFTIEYIRGMKEAELEVHYKVNRATARAALAEIVANSNSNK